MKPSPDPWQPHLVEWSLRTREAASLERARVAREALQARERGKPDPEHLVEYDGEPWPAAEDFSQEAQG